MRNKLAIAIGMLALGTGGRAFAQQAPPPQQGVIIEEDQTVVRPAPAQQPPVAQPQMGTQEQQPPLEACPMPGAAVTPAPVTTVQPTEYRAQKREKLPNYSFELGGGVSNFAHTALSDIASTAGNWDARLTLGLRSPLSFEAGYMGSAQAAADPVGPNPSMISTQVTGLARLNLVPYRFHVQPFLDAGAGWVNFHRYGDDVASPIAASNFNKNTNEVVIPMGGGIAGYLGKHGVIDARAEYRLVTGKAFDTLTMRPDMWVAQLNAGYTF